MKTEAMSLARQAEEAIINATRFEDMIQTGAADARPEELRQIELERNRAKKLLKYRADVQQTVARADGRRVLWRILELCGPNRISYVPGDTHATAVNEGKRIIANEVLLMLFDADPNVYAQMQREALSNLKSEQAEQESSR